MSGTSPAVHRLAVALAARPRDDDSRRGAWRWELRHRLSEVREALVREGYQPTDGWLAARRGSVLRERQALLTRVALLGPEVLESSDLDRVAADLRRLVADLTHHCQRLHDLAYDEVELELGGSE